MAEDGPGHNGASGGGGAHAADGINHDGEKITPKPMESRKSTWAVSPFDVHVSGMATPLGAHSRRSSGIDLDEYFVGPKDLDQHSKLPYFLRLHGSVLPRMILPVICVGAWATFITVLCKKVVNLGVNNILLTILGFVVALSLSFRSTTAYERYADGRKAWTLLSVHSRNLSRYIWVHIDERTTSEAQEKEDLLAKVTTINLILAFAVSLKHRLRFEPYAHYPDLACLVAHLDTFAKNAHTEKNFETRKVTPWKAVGEYLGMSFANSNPRKEIKRADKPLGNLPQEILTYISSYLEETTVNGTLKNAVILGQMLTAISALTDTQASAERVLTTPLPVGYNIIISQIVLLYVYLLPFQLYPVLDWKTIPGTIAAAYIILGIHAIGNELENPFGNDVNDLPLDSYCAELSRELDTLMATPAPKFNEHLGLSRHLNQPLWPLSHGKLGEWRQRDVGDLRAALRAKAFVGKNGGGIGVDGVDVAGTPGSAGSTLRNRAGTNGTVSEC